MLVFCVVLPILFAVAIPMARQPAGEGERVRAHGLLIMFQDKEYFRQLSDVTERVSNNAGYEIARLKDEDRTEHYRRPGNAFTLAEQIWELVIASASNSLIGGLIVMLCFSIWKPSTEWAGVCAGSWPIFVCALAAYIGCMFLTIEDETFMKNVTYILITANFCLLLLRVQNTATHVVWQFVKGVFLYILACGIFAIFMSIFCMYTMLDIGRLSGQDAYVTLFGLSFTAGVMIAVYDWFADAAEPTLSDSHYTGGQP